jgi:SAM-dependent methyltransferase
MTDNAIPAHDWAGAMGDRWLAHLDRFESMIEPAGRALLSRASYVPGERVVDIGCGGGWTTRQIARAVGGSGLAVGLDIAPVLVAAAARRADEEGIGNIRFEQGDAARAMPPEAPFDRLFSRFGVMFFAEPPAAFANLHRMLRPDGRLDIAVWASAAENPWTGSIMGLVGQHVALPAPEPRAPGPFALGDLDYLRELLGGAGFRDVGIEAWTGELYIGGRGTDPEGAARFVLEGMQVGDLLRAGGEAVLSRAEAGLAALFRGHQDAVGVHMTGKAWLVSALA